MQIKYSSAFLSIFFLFYSSLAMAELPTLGDPTLKAFSSKEELKLGKAFYQALRTNLEFIDDLPLNYYLKSLGKKLASHSDAAGQRFKFYIVKSDSINAFAGPDAHIGINSGLILKSRNESQLASVLAHEISHISQRHLARAIDASGQSVVATFATVLAAILLGAENPEAGHAILVTGMAGAQQASLNFTRSNEYESDRIGISILSKAGINPSGMVEFFEILLSQSGTSDFEYLRTHPLSSNRVSEARNRIKEENAALPNDSEDFRFAKARLEVLAHPRPEKIMNHSEISTESSIIERYRKALAYTRSDQPSGAIQLLSAKPVNEPVHPWVKMALADAYLDNNQPEHGLAILEALSTSYPGYLPVTMAYTKALIDNQQSLKSISLLKHQLQKDDDAIIHQTLAHAYFINGQVAAALESTGNQYERQGYIELATQQYNSALQQPKINITTRQRLETKIQALKKALQSE